jgi:hypothetical protein
MLIFTEIADWFEDQRKRSDQILDQWVEDSNYSQGVMLVAATTTAFTTFGAGFADILRLGDGIKEGSWRGFGTDALRVAAVFPVGKAASVLRSAKNTHFAKLVLNTGGPICFWVVSAKAFTQIGHRYNGKLLASVDDIAKALRIDPNHLWRIWDLGTGLAYLRQLGARVGHATSVRAAAEAEKMVPHDGSVVILAVRIMNRGHKKGNHAVYIFRNVFGQIRYMDRKVGDTVSNVFNSLDDVGRSYQNTNFVPYEAAILYNVFAKTVAHDTHILVMPVLGVIATEEPK